MQSTSKSAFVGLISLLSSSAIGAIGLALIASQRWPILVPAASTELLLVLQWQLLGVLICKSGADQAVFAMISRNPRLVLSISPEAVLAMVVTALAFALATAYVFSWHIALIVLITLLLDSFAIVGSASLNGRAHHIAASIGTLLNYPVFFLLLLIASRIGSLNTHDVLWLFCIASLTRLLWVQHASRLAVRRSKDSIKLTFSITLNPLLNHLAFRGDQLLLALLISTAPLLFSPAQSSQYVFLAKFPELAGGVLVYVGLVVFPRLTFASPLDCGALPNLLRHNWLWCVFAIVAIATAGIVYVTMYVREDISLVTAIPFLVHAALVFPVNLMSFMMYRLNCLAALLRNLFVALIAGGLWFALGSTLGSAVSALAWMVPIQLSVFLFLCITFPWHRQAAG